MLIYDIFHPCFFVLVIELRDGSGPHEGRVEVFMTNKWGTVCWNGWHQVDARMVCHLSGFGFAGSAVTSRSTFPTVTRDIFFTQVNCRGSESSILECGNNGFKNTNCAHYQDAGVICSGKYNA